MSPHFLHGRSVIESYQPMPDPAASHKVLLRHKRSRPAHLLSLRQPQNKYSMLLDVYKRQAVHSLCIVIRGKIQQVHTVYLHTKFNIKTDILYKLCIFIVVKSNPQLLQVLKIIYLIPRISIQCLSLHINQLLVNLFWIC